MREKRARVSYENASQVVAILQSIGSGCQSLSMRAREAHWNVKGESFGSLHDLFGDLYDFLNDNVDVVAERIVQLGGIASALTGEWPPKPLMGDHTTLLQQLAASATVLAGEIKEAFTYLEGDKISEDILIELGRELEKKIWMLESHLQRCQKMANKRDK